MCSNVKMVLVNQPSPNFSNAVPGALSVALPVDMNLVYEQWHRFTTAIERHCEVPVRRLRINHQLPDGRYLEDGVRIVTTDQAEKSVRGARPVRLLIVMPYGHEQRRPERKAVRQAVKKHGGDFDEEIVLPPRLRGDGGDTYYSPAVRTLFVGLSGRTTEDLCAALHDRMKPFGVNVVGIPLAPWCLHLITGSSLVDDDTVAVHAPSFKGNTRAFRDAGLKVIEIDEAEQNGANLFAANGKLIGDADSPRSIDRLENCLGRSILRLKNCQSGLRHGSFTCDTIVIPN